MPPKVASRLVQKLSEQPSKDWALFEIFDWEDQTLSRFLLDQDLVLPATALWRDAGPVKLCVKMHPAKHLVRNIPTVSLFMHRGVLVRPQQSPQSRDTN